MTHTKEWSVCLEILVGNLLIAAGYGFFLLPLGFAAGNVVGLAQIAVHFMPDTLSIFGWIILFDLLLFCVGWLYLGFSEVKKRMLHCLIFPFATFAFLKWNFFGEMLHDVHFCAIICGALLGIGNGLVVRGGAAMCDFDIIGEICNKKLGLPWFHVAMVLDFLVVVAQGAWLSMLEVAYGFFVFTELGTIYHEFLARGKEGGRMYIFSGHHGALQEVLSKDMHLRLAYFNAEDGWERKPVQVMMAVMPFHEIERVKRRVHKTDPDAVIVMDTVNSIDGGKKRKNEKNL